MLMQIPPLRAGAGDPENTIENKAMIFRPSPTMRPATRHERLKTSPFLIRHQPSNQSRLPAKTTVNQNYRRLGILFVNKT